MKNDNFTDKEQEIRYLRTIIDAYEKVTDLSNEELVDAYKTISAKEKATRTASEELIQATVSLEELKGRETKITEEIIKILDEDLTNEELILHKLEALSKNSSSGFFSDLFYVIANLEFSEEEATLFWKEIYTHTIYMCEKMGRNVSFRVALLDHILMNNRIIKNPKIIELNLFDSVVKNSVIDELTNLYNRRYFNLTLRRELKRAKRYNRPVCLFLFDVDNFKVFNDTYGHIVGDAVLKIIAATLKECFRQEDTICRFGGEEFTVILPEVDTKAAFIACKRFAETLKVNSMNQLKKIISISGGITEYPKNGETPEELYSKADIALYKAKNSGKDGIIIHTE